MMDKLKDFWQAIIDKIKGFHEYLGEHKGARIAFWVFLVILAIGGVQHIQAAREQHELDMKTEQQAMKDAQEAGENTDSEDTQGKSQVVIQYDEDQKDLQEKYGQPKKGYSWDEDGNLIAKGDEKKKSSEVGRIYMQSVSKLDAQQLEKFSYPGSVLKTLNKFYDKDSDFSTLDNFKASVYKEALKSLQVIDVADDVHYANNKDVITYNVRYLDLSYKGFWLKDKSKLFDDMFETTKAESDKEKVQDYLYDYVLNYYQSKRPSYKKGQITIVLQKSANNGWLVTNDGGVDAIGKYSDDDVTNGPVGQIMNEFEDYYDDQEGAKPNWNAQNINGDSNVEGKQRDEDDPNGDKTLQGDTGEETHNPFDD